MDWKRFLYGLSLPFLLILIAFDKNGLLQRDALSILLLSLLVLFTGVTFSLSYLSPRKVKLAFFGKSWTTAKHLSSSLIGTGVIACAFLSVGQVMRSNVLVLAPFIPLILIAGLVWRMYVLHEPQRQIEGKALRKTSVTIMREIPNQKKLLHWSVFFFTCMGILLFQTGTYFALTTALTFFIGLLTFMFICGRKEFVGALLGYSTKHTRLLIWSFLLAGIFGNGISQMGVFGSFLSPQTLAPSLMTGFAATMGAMIPILFIESISLVRRDFKSICSPLIFVGAHIVGSWAMVMIR